MSPPQDGKLTIKINQSYPEIGDKVYQSQQLQLCVYGLDSNGDMHEKFVPYKMQAAASTDVTIDYDASLKPVACLLNSGNLGYLRTIIDDNTINFFLYNVMKISQQADRTQIWNILAQHVENVKLNPDRFIECAITNLP